MGIDRSLDIRELSGTASVLFVFVSPCGLFQYPLVVMINFEDGAIKVTVVVLFQAILEDVFGGFVPECVHLSIVSCCNSCVKVQFIDTSVVLSIFCLWTLLTPQSGVG